MQYWAKETILQTENETHTAEIIKYLYGILQGDCLSLLLFKLSLNPLSFLLNKIPDGYKIGESNARNKTISHLIFVDDLKTYAKNQQEALKQLDVITTFSNDIVMKFGSEKCAYINIEKGKQKSLGTKVIMNDLEIKELTTGEPYI